MSALSVVPKAAPVSLTLYEIEDLVRCYVDTEAAVQPEDEQQFIAEFTAALSGARNKRDQVGRFMLHLDDQIEFCQRETARIAARREQYERALARIEEYVVRVIRSFEPDAKGRYPKLEGDSVTFSVRRNPASVEITAAESIPAEHICRTVSVRLPAALWETILDSLDFDVAQAALDCKPQADANISKTALKKALEAGPVEGARLINDKYILVRK